MPGCGKFFIIFLDMRKLLIGKDVKLLRTKIHQVVEENLQRKKKMVFMSYMGPPFFSSHWN